MARIAPSLLSADFANLGLALETCASAGVDLVHLDVMDGHFVPNLTFGPPVVASLRGRSALPFDVHLMVARPMEWIAPFREAGADRISVHVEAEPHLRRALARIRESGAAPGVALNPATSLALLEDTLDYVDFVLIMSVDPGFGGQSFLPATVGRVARLRETIRGRGLAVEIAVDGGIGEAEAGPLVRAGADVLIAGTAFFRAADPARVARALKNSGGSTA